MCDVSGVVYRLKDRLVDVDGVGKGEELRFDGVGDGEDGYRDRNCLRDGFGTFSTEDGWGWMGSRGGEGC